jgi:hypothetical protein
MNPPREKIIERLRDKASESKKDAQLIQEVLANIRGISGQDARVLNCMAECRLEDWLLFDTVARMLTTDKKEDGP